MSEQGTETNPTRRWKLAAEPAVQDAGGREKATVASFAAAAF